MTRHVFPRLVRVSSLGVLALLSGCQEPSERPPTIETCPPGTVCYPGSAEQPEPGDEDDGDGDGEGAGGAAPDVVRGSVREIVDDLFTSSTAFTGDATVVAEGERRGVVEAAYTGVGVFELEGFKASDPLWLGAYPESNLRVLPTLSPVPLDAAFHEIDLGVVREENLDLVFQLSTTSSERAAGTGQIILSFTDDTSARQGMSGVRVSMPEAEFISYANAGSWSDADIETDRTGLVVLANVDASEFPGSTRRVYLSGRATGYISVRVAAGAVSLVEIPVE